MSETPESRTEPASVTPNDRGAQPARERSNRLNQVAAWVGITAGVVFILAVIFFTGVFVGTRLDSDDHPRIMRCEMTGPGSMMGPDRMMEPGGQVGPGGQPSPTIPTTPGS